MAPHEQDKNQNSRDKADYKSRQDSDKRLQGRIAKSKMMNESCEQIKG
ncbi:hypothetical protein [Desulfonatronovibrio magnus]|nr:hypothetical protein [Desulfonatronovibrio magnus]